MKCTTDARWRRSTHERVGTVLFLVAASAFALLLLTSCSGMSETLSSPEGGALANQVVQHAADAGINAASGNWVAAITSAATAMAGVLGIVRLWRGGVNSRKGAPPEVAAP